MTEVKKPVGRILDEATVVKQLNLKQDLRVDPIRKRIEHNVSPESKGDVGKGSKGKLDFLVRHNNYAYERFTDNKLFNKH